MQTHPIPKHSISAASPSCIVCRSPAVRPYVFFRGFQSWRCPTCDHTFVPLQSGEVDFDAFYGESFYENYMSGLGYDKAVETHLQGDFLKKVRLLHELLPQGGRVLDVGAGPGYFAELLEKSGKFLVTAAELNPGAIAYAKAKGVEFQNFVTEDLHSPYCSIHGQKFDCVISWAVIEHVEDPRAYLALLASYVKDGGLVLLDTGVTNRFFEPLDTGFTNWLFPPMHLHVFADRSLKYLVEESGLEVIRFWRFFDLFRFHSLGYRLRIAKHWLRNFLIALRHPKAVLHKKNSGHIAHCGLMIARKIQPQ